MLTTLFVSYLLLNGKRSRIDIDSEQKTNIKRFSKVGLNFRVHMHANNGLFEHTFYGTIRCSFEKDLYANYFVSRTVPFQLMTIQFFLVVKYNNITLITSIISTHLSIRENYFLSILTIPQTM